jgi:hypothetical protein
LNALKGVSGLLVCFQTRKHINKVFNKYGVYASKNLQPDEGRKSNPRKKILDDKNQTSRNAEQQQKRHTPKVGNVVRESNASREVVIFERGVCSKKARRELYIIEEDDRFEVKSLRGKMATVIKNISEELKEMYYDLGVSDKLPKSGRSLKVL